MDSHYGFKLQELCTHEEIDIIQERMKAVVQFRYGKDSQDHYLGTGFFLCNDPFTLLTARHVVEKYIEGSNFKKGVYFRLNYNDDLFKENETNTYIFNMQDKAYLNKTEDFAVIILSRTPTKEITSLYTDISMTLPPSSPSSYDFPSCQPGSNISIIHHPTEESKYIATTNENYCVVHVNWNYLLNIGYMKKNNPNVAKFKTRQRFAYWAMHQKSTTSTPIRCTDCGSSGSPIFNKQWKLIGMHIEGSRLKTQNGESKYFKYGIGVPISLIIKHLQIMIKNIKNNSKIKS
ncbi:MAG: trypsin-like serine peptidase [Candidatus Hodarchaeales archaeon]